MKITKREIAEKTTCTRGTGFDPYWSYFYQDLETYETISRGFYDSEVFDDRYGLCIGHAENKKEFVQVIYDYLNDEELMMKRNPHG